MATTHLAQKLYDKARLDAQEFRKALGEWAAKSGGSGFSYGGSSQDHLWAMPRDHLMRIIPEYFDWIDKEARIVAPSDLRKESIEQCVGAVVSHSRRVRSMTMDMHARLAKTEQPTDLGHWDGIDDRAITARGAALLRSFGLDSKRSLPSRLNHLIGDHAWFFAALAIISLLISVAAFFR